MCCLLTHTVHNNASRILKEAPSDLGRSKTSYTLSPLNDFNWPLRSVPPKYLKITDASYPIEGNQLQGLIFYLLSYKAQVLLLAYISHSRVLHVRVTASQPDNLSRENNAHCNRNNTINNRLDDLNSELEVICYSS